MAVVPPTQIVSRHGRLRRSLVVLSLLTGFAVVSAGPAWAVSAPVTSSAASLVVTPATLERLAETIDSRRQDLNVPGVSLVVVQGDQVLFSRGFGHRDVARQQPVTDKTLFAIGSTTKAFTGLTALMAVDERKLSLEDHPRRFLPYFRLQDADADRRVTVRDLLSHRTGVGRTDLAMLSGRLTASELVRLMGEVKPMAPLRSQFHYQNTMYAAAGMIAGRALGMDWEQAVTERIFRPLGMTGAVTSTEGVLASADISYGYRYDKATERFERLPFRPINHSAPAGSISASVSDLAQWLRFINAGGVNADGVRLVSPAGFSEWFAPQITLGPKQQYALGWFLDDWQGQQHIWHSGSIDGFNAAVGFLPDKKIGYALLTNVSGTPLTSQVGPLVFEALLGAQPVPAAASSDQLAGPLKADDPAAKALLGPYKAEKFGLDMQIVAHEGQVALIVPGQPPYPLVPTAADRYKLDKLPAGFALEVQRDEQGAIGQLTLKQPHGDLVLTPVTVDLGSLTVAELMAKAVDALGGEARLRQLQSMVVDDRVSFLHQGFSGQATTWRQAGVARASAMTLTALGKPVITMLDYVNGNEGASLQSFGLPQAKHGAGLADARNGTVFFPELDWQRYRDVQITGQEPIDGEAAYVVVFTPHEGHPFTGLYSTKTHLKLQHRAIETVGDSGVTLPYAVNFGDYRPVDGVKVPFFSRISNPAVGEVIVRTQAIRFNAEIPSTVFGPQTLPALD